MYANFLLENQLMTRLYKNLGQLADQEQEKGSNKANTAFDEENVDRRAPPPWNLPNRGMVKVVDFDDSNVPGIHPGVHGNE